MAPVQWSNLPGCILYSINKLLNSDIDLLRLRSVCSSWRSSLSLAQKPFSFPLKLPLESSDEESGGYYTLQENTLYRLAPPNDPYNGWMFKVSETNTANTFSLIIPLSIDKMNHPPGTIPNHLNLLDYQIHQVSKSYCLSALNHDASSLDLEASESIKKVITLLDYVADCDLAALALHFGGRLNYWKLGDESWTPIDIDTETHEIQDLILHNGRCYAVDSKGILVMFDSKLQFTVVASSAGEYPAEQHNFLVESESDLYLVSKAYGLGPEFFYDYSDNWETIVDFSLMLRKFNKWDASWDVAIEDVGEKVIVLGEEASVAVSVVNFRGCKGNCVYLADWCFIDDSESDVYGDMAGVYHLDDRRAVRMAMDGDSRKLYWPPPSWLMPNARSSSQD